MALTDIQTYAGSVTILDFSRGNIGTVLDSISRGLNELKLPIPGAGGAVFPATTKVITGEIYGPNGTDYTGNVTLPAETDVKLNTQYGANGTEFTGELAGGGNVFVICD